MQRPDNRLSRIENPPNIPKRKHSLIYPMQMYHIGLLKLGRTCNINSRIGYIDRKKVMFPKTVCRPHDYAFP